jgi:hypothetical protein
MGFPARGHWRAEEKARDMRLRVSLNAQIVQRSAA